MVLLKKTCMLAVLLFAIRSPLSIAQQANAVPLNEISAQGFRDSTAGMTSAELVRRALLSNADLAASRLEVDRAKGRLRQAGLTPNPSVDYEETTGRLTGSPGEKERSIGVSMPIEIGKRGKRVNLAHADLAAADAEVADRERRLTVEVRAAFADVMAALRDLEITSELNTLDTQTSQFLQNRVSEGDAPPLELNLFRAEADRLRSRRALVQGRLQAGILRLKTLAAIPARDPLRFREDLTSILLPEPPTLEQALQMALATRPDLQVARLNEEVAQAGLKLARSQALPDLSLSAKYSVGNAVFDHTPVGELRDRDKLLTFGASVTIPIFNRNQGTRIEAEATIIQARRRREFLESLVNAEVASAYSRYEAARAAVAIYEPGVIERSEQNVRAVRGAYEIGAFRITELLTEQRRLIDFQREYTEALAERYRALADLQAAIGTRATP